jgi:hypothetical protein
MLAKGLSAGEVTDLTGLTKKQVVSLLASSNSQ